MLDNLIYFRRSHAKSNTNMNASRSNEARINQATSQGDAFIKQWKDALLTQEFSVKQLFDACFMLLAEASAIYSHLPSTHEYEPTFFPKDLEE